MTIVVVDRDEIEDVLDEPREALTSLQGKAPKVLGPIASRLLMAAEREAPDCPPRFRGIAPHARGRYKYAELTEASWTQSEKKLEDF